LTYVNERITVSQLLSGAFTVFLDGLSEIPKQTEDGSATNKLADFIRDQADTHFVITSRNSIPRPVLDALGRVTVISLLDLDKSTEKTFVEKYLQRADDAKEFLELIQRNCPQVPRIPLMFRLLAEIYNSSGTVPRDRSTLYASYLARILRPESTGIKAVVGVQFGVRQLVKATYLMSHGERRGFFEEDGIKILSTLRQELADRDVVISPNTFLTILTQSGLLRCINGYFSFFHDSFESYYAACAIERDIRRNELDLAKTCYECSKLVEVWNFVEELFDVAGDRIILDSTLAGFQSKGHTTTSS
jgi:hypothetical protein